MRIPCGALYSNRNRQSPPTEAELSRVTLKLLYIALMGFGKSIESTQYSKFNCHLALHFAKVGEGVKAPQITRDELLDYARQLASLRAQSISTNLSNAHSPTFSRLASDTSGRPTTLPISNWRSGENFPLPRRIRTLFRRPAPLRLKPSNRSPEIVG
jgi:hypothetical protein